MLHIRLLPNIKRAFKTLASSKGVTMTALAVMIITDYLSRQDKEAA